MLAFLPSSWMPQHTIIPFPLLHSSNLERSCLASQSEEEHNTTNHNKASTSESNDATQDSQDDEGRDKGKGSFAFGGGQ